MCVCLVNGVVPLVLLTFIVEYSCELKFRKHVLKNNVFNT